MNAEHYNELIELSQKIYDGATEKLTNYLSARYCAIGNDTMQEQMEDYLFVTVETSAYFLGNALALLTPQSQSSLLALGAGSPLVSIDSFASLPPAADSTLY